MPHYDSREDGKKTAIAQPVSDLRSPLAPTQVAGGASSPTTPAGPQPRGADGVSPTTIVGFNKPELPSSGAARPAAAPPRDAPSTPAEGPVVGWLVVVAGPGRGCAKEIFVGMNTIGREPNHNRIAIDFGDTSISREKAAVLAYDPIDNRYTLMPGESANIVRVSRAAVYAPTKLEPGDTLTLGQTELRFVPLCGPDFQWEQG